MPHRLRHARAYPYDAPEHSYVLTQLGPVPMHEEAWEALQYLTPVIASGSNRAPERLMKKFQGLAHSPIPVTLAEVHGLDSVYSAHVSSYGAIPATLHPTPGTVSHLAVTWLDDIALQRMHETESLGVNYDFEEMTGVRVEVDGRRTIENAFAYISRRGAFSPDGSPIALAPIDAQNRTFTELDQESVMARAHAHLNIVDLIDDFFLSLIEDADRRLHISGLMEQAGLSFANRAA